MLLVLFSNTALFSFIFRTVLIRFADRGLVLQGQPNLRLFDQLFWVILVPYCCIGLGMAPIHGIIKGTFYKNFDFKVCNFKSIADHDVLRNDIMPLMSPFLVWIYCMYLKFKTNRYLQGICSQKKCISLANLGEISQHLSKRHSSSISISSMGYSIRGFAFGWFKHFLSRPKPIFCLQT